MTRKSGREFGQAASPGDEVAVEARPDWGKIEEHPRCPLCEYDLFGVDQPRCPECGYRFRWSEIRKRHLESHPFLFEHHPERRFRTFWQTWLASWRPSVFWGQLHPAQRPRSRRLMLYWLMGMAQFCILGLPFFVAYEAMYRLSWWRGSGVELAEVGRAFLSALTRLEWPWVMGTFAVLPAVLGWLCWLVLLVFGESMRKAKIRRAHVLRCALYSFDPMVNLALVGAWLLMFVLDRLAFSRPTGFGGGDFLVLAEVAAGLIGFYRLYWAYRLYLRFDRPLATVAAALVIVGLVIAIVVIPMLASFR